MLVCLPLPVCLSVCLCLCLSVCLSVYVSVYVSLSVSVAPFLICVPESVCVMLSRIYVGDQSLGVAVGEWCSSHSFPDPTSFSVFAQWKGNKS